MNVVVADRHPPVPGALSHGGSVVELIERAAPLVDPHGELLWVSPAVGAGGSFRASDRRLVVELAGVSPAAHEAYYLEVGAGRIWPVLHGLAAPPPAETDVAWASYERVNEALARSVAAAAPPGASITVHDYSVLLAVPAIRAIRPDVRLGYVHHTPWPDERGVDEPWRRALLHRLFRAAAAADVVFVSAERWSSNLAGWGELPRVRVVRPGVDVETLRLRATTPGDGRWGGLLDEGALEPPVVAAVGRADPSKNFDTLVRAWTDLVARGQQGTLCIHQVPTTRARVDIYSDYGAAVDRALAAANRQRPGCVVVSEEQDKDDALRLLQHADVVAACSRADGWNLVGAEAVALGPDHQQLVLSSGVGAVELLGPTGHVVGDPDSPTAVAEALRAALDAAARPAEPRARPALPTPQDWWRAILSALEKVPRPAAAGHRGPFRTR